MMSVKQPLEKFCNIIWRKAQRKIPSNIEMELWEQVWFPVELKTWRQVGQQVKVQITNEVV